MRIKVTNRKCKIVTGGVDNLIDYDLYKNLKRELSVFVPNHERTLKFKQRVWDGKIRFITKSLEFNTGFLPAVYGMLTDAGFKITLEDYRDNVISYPESIVTELQAFPLRDYQERLATTGMHNMLSDMYFPRGIYNAATNAGKNSIITSIILSLKANTLVLVHRKELLKQIKSALETEGIEVHQVGLGKFSTGNVTVAMYKTLLNKTTDVNVKAYLDSVECLLVDECHRAASKEYMKLIDQINAFAVYYFSGTPLASENAIDHMNIFARSGAILEVIENKFLMEKGYSQEIQIIMLNYDERTLHPGEMYDDEVSRIRYSKDKLQMMRHVCETFPKDQILIPVESIEHGKFLIKNLINLPTTIEFVTGPDKDRDEKLERFKNKTTRILIATMLMKEGINIPTINTIIYAAGGKSETTIKQLAGRLVRADGINDTCKFFDFNDIGGYVGKHVEKRLEIYRKENFKILT